MYKCQNQTEMTVKNGKQTNLKSDSHLPKKIILFALMKDL